MQVDVKARLICEHLSLQPSVSPGGTSKLVKESEGSQSPRAGHPSSMDILPPTLVVALEHPRQPPCPPPGFLSWASRIHNSLGDSQHPTPSCEDQPELLRSLHRCHLPWSSLPIHRFQGSCPRGIQAPGVAEANSGQTQSKSIWRVSFMHHFTQSS